MSKKVFLGVGHGGSDPGAIGNGFEEADLNLPIALACGNELTRHGVSVLLSRYKDENDTLTEEINECNAFAPDLAVDIHNNAGGGDGAEAFHTYKGGTGKTLAVNILDEIVKVGQNSRGAKTRRDTDGTDYYGFIRCTKAPAVIVECAFVDNAKDIQIVDTAAEQKAMGVAIAKGILKTLGIAYKAETEQKPESNVRYIVQVGYDKYKELVAAGYNGFVVTCEAASEPVMPEAPKVDTIEVGDTVRLREGATDYYGTKLADFVYERNHIVKEISGDRVVITHNGVTIAAVKMSDLEKV